MDPQRSPEESDDKGSVFQSVRPSRRFLGIGHQFFLNLPKFEVLRDTASFFEKKSLLKKWTKWTEFVAKIVL